TSTEDLNLSGLLWPPRLPGGACAEHTRGPSCRVVSLDQYKPFSEIGRGGMGVVYKGRSADGREVAVKVLLRADKRKHAARFDRERRLLEELGEHEGFVPLLDAGDSPQGPFIVMPYFGGGTLRDRLRKGPLDLKQTISLGHALAKAMAKAHGAGVVHRDLKPDNVLFTMGGRPLVADLGLAKHYRYDEPEQKSVSLSHAGTAIGTLGYMAPEQMKNAKAVGPEVDVWALGAILYECLAGVKLYRAKSALELLDLVEQGHHEPLPETVPSWLRETIERAIATSPKERFQNGAELAAAIERGAGTLRRSRRTHAFVGGAFAATLLGGLLVVFAAPRNTKPVVEPVAAVVSSGTEVVAPVASPEAVAVPELPDPTGEKVSKKERSLAAQAEAAAMSGQSAEAYKLYCDLGERALTKEHPKLAALAFEKAVVCASAKRDKLHALSQLGFTETKLGSFESARSTLGRAIELAPDSALLRNNLGYVLHILGRDGEAIEEYRRSVELDPDQNLARMSLGILARTEGDAGRALKEHKALLKPTLGVLDLGGSWYFRFESVASKATGSGVSLKDEAQRFALVRLQIALDKVYLDDLAGAEKTIQGAKDGAFENTDLEPAVLKTLDDINKGLEKEPLRHSLRFMAGVLHAIRGDKERARTELEAFKASGGKYSERAAELLQSLK
ncbi:MAG: protein kinase, partial [Planctomycetota bacterium]